jgi:hypothetical protein
VSLPAVLEVRPSPESEGLACHCFCIARHPEQMGVCKGFLGEDGVRAHFNSTYSPPEGVAICGPCIHAYPGDDSRKGTE